jgi:hypothetical protein
MRGQTRHECCCVRGGLIVRKPMKFFVHYALIFTISLLLLKSIVLPEFEQTGQFWSQIGTAVHKTGAP